MKQKSNAVKFLSKVIGFLLGLVKAKEEKIMFDNRFQLCHESGELYLKRNKINQTCMDDEGRVCSSSCPGFHYDEGKIGVLINCRIRPVWLDLLTKEQRKMAEEKAKEIQKEGLPTSTKKRTGGNGSSKKS